MTATYDCIATTTLSTTQSSVTFSSISGSFTDIVIVVAGGQPSQGDNLLARFNSDSGNNYSFTELLGNGTSASSNIGSNTSAARFQNNIGGANDLGQTYIAHIMNYSNTTTYKTMLARANQTISGTTFPGTGAYVNLWRSTSAITSITILRTGAGDLLSGTIITLYGIKSEA